MGLRLSPFLPVFVLATLSAIPLCYPLDTVLSIYLGGSEGGHQSSINLSSKLLGVWSLTIVIVVGYFARIIDWTFRCPENGGMSKTGLLHVGEFAGQNKLVIINKH